MDINSINIKTESHIVTPESFDVGSAVGVDKRYWFIAIVKNNTEKSAAQKLHKAGYDCFVATQKDVRVWRTGRRVSVDRVVITSAVFIYCTECERRIVVNEPYISRFLTNKAAASTVGGRPVATIPEVQIRNLRFMLGHSDTPVGLVDRTYGRGDRVRVIRGSLCGLEGEVLVSNEGQSELLVRLDILGCAKCAIDLVDVELIR